MGDYHTDVEMLEVDTENVYSESIDMYAAFVKENNGMPLQRTTMYSFATKDF
jgi:hypothetical protein